MKYQFGFSKIKSVLILFASALLISCSGGGGTPVTTVNTSLDTNARGYYENNASATIEVAAGDKTINNGDIKSIFDEKNFLIAFKASSSDMLLYKGTFTEVTSSTFKATLRVYRNGNFVAESEITNGQIDAGVSIKGAIAGTGAYTSTDYANSVGDIELAYNNANNLTPITTYNTTTWQDSSPVTGAIRFDTQTQVDLIIAINGVPNPLNCDSNDIQTQNVVYNQTGRIRKFLSSPLSSCNENTIEGNQLNGYFTNFNGGGTDDDRILLLISDDNYAYIGIIPCGTGTGNCF